jgi:hypothetical protein
MSSEAFRQALSRDFELPQDQYLNIEVSDSAVGRFRIKTLV